MPKCREPSAAEQTDADLIAMTIARERRDVLYDQLVADLSAVGDLRIDLRERR